MNDWNKLTKEELKASARENMMNKRIVLFGAGKVAVEFYRKYKDILNISHCVSNLKREWGSKRFQDELDVLEFRSEDIKETDYLIVCGPYAFRQIEPQLLNCGYQMFLHFIESEIAECILSGKKIVLFRGSCILRDIHECILKSERFGRQYVSIFGTDNYAVSKFDNRVIYHASKICDYFIYSYRILRQDKIYLITEEDLSQDCEIISVSNISFPAYWPQADPEVRNSNRYLIHPYNIERDVVFYHTMYRLEDRNLNRMVEDGWNLSQIWEAVSSEDFYSEKDVRRNFKVALKSLQIAEKFTDVRVMDFIESTYNKEMIFQNFSHMHKCVAWAYVRRIFALMGVDTNECDLLEAQSPKYIHHGGDIPVYPSVAKHMGLDWINEDTTYEIMTYHGVEHMTFRQYVEHYVEYTYKAQKIMASWQV